MEWFSVSGDDEKYNDWMKSESEFRYNWNKSCILYILPMYIYSFSEQTNKTFNNLANFAPGFFKIQIRNSQNRDRMRIFKSTTQILNSNLDCQIQNLYSNS